MSHKEISDKMQHYISIKEGGGNSWPQSSKTQHGKIEKSHGNILD